MCNRNWPDPALAGQGPRNIQGAIENQYEICLGNYFDLLRDVFISKENLDSIDRFPAISGPFLYNSVGARDAIVSKTKPNVRSILLFLYIYMKRKNFKKLFKKRKVNFFLSFFLFFLPCILINKISSNQ